MKFYPCCFLSLLLALVLSGVGVADQRDEMRLYMQGDFVFRRHCADCHGQRGQGDGPLAEGVEIRPRDFRKGIFKFRSTPMGKMPTEADLARTIRKGVSGSLMPAFENLSEQEVAGLIVFIKSMSRRWKDPALKGEPVKIPKEPEWFADEEKIAERVAAGRLHFGTHCVSCHGEKGKGDGVAAPALVDHQGTPIVPVDFTNSNRRSGAERGDVFRTIATGLDGTPMAGYLEPMGVEAIWEVVAYVESLVEEVRK